MDPFVKLKIKTDISECLYGDEMVHYGVNRSIEFFKIQESMDARLFEIVPEKYKKYFYTSIMRINEQYIRPHTDSDRKVGINFYIKPASAITLFYNRKENSPDAEKVIGQTNGAVYNESNLILNKKFIAETGDIWILDITQIHSVVCLKKEKRVAYNLSSNVLSYDDTLEILKHLI
jgi:hypothetical protein